MEGLQTFLTPRSNRHHPPSPPLSRLAPLPFLPLFHPVPRSSPVLVRYPPSPVTPAALGCLLLPALPLIPGCTLLWSVPLILGCPLLLVLPPPSLRAQSWSHPAPRILLPSHQALAPAPALRFPPQRVQLCLPLVFPHPRTLESTIVMPSAGSRNASRIPSKRFPTIRNVTYDAGSPIRLEPHGSSWINIPHPPGPRSRGLGVVLSHLLRNELSRLLSPFPLFFDSRSFLS